jgi:hypothetical protein
VPGWRRPGSFATGTLLLATFELSMADWPSGLVLLVILPLTALIVLRLLLLDGDAAVSRPPAWLQIRDPVSDLRVTLVLLQYAPLNKVALQQNFQWHRADRERIVARVQAGQLKPNVSYNENLIALGGNEPNVSAGGNDIVVDQAQEGTTCCS